MSLMSVSNEVLTYCNLKSQKLNTKDTQRIRQTEKPL